MRDVVIKTGVYGHRIEGTNGSFRVHPVAKGERVALPDDEAARLVRLGIAEIASAAPAVAPQNGHEPAGASQDTTGEKEAAEGATSGESGDSENITVSRLERMPKADLEQMAQDMGVDISGAKNNRERAELLAAAMADEDGDGLPEIEDEDIVR